MAVVHCGIIVAYKHSKTSIHSMIDYTKLFAGGAIFSGVVAFWDKIKSFAWRLISLLVQQVEIPNKDVRDAVIAYLIDNYKYSSTYDKVYGAIYESLRNGRYGLVPYELFGQRSLVFWNGMYPFLFNNKQSTDNSGHEESRNRYEQPDTMATTITFLRGKLNIDELIFNACDARNKSMWRVAQDEKIGEKRFTVYYVPKKKASHDEYEPTSDGLPWYQQSNYRLIGITSEQLGKAIFSSGKALDNLIFPDKVKNLIKEVERWCRSKDWYRSKNIPWKRGWLLYGPPGTGKTALARAFAEDLDLPIYVYSLAQMDNATLMKAWAKMQVNVPCIALLEDIDNVFHGRNNISRRFPVMSFSNYSDEDDENGNGEKPEPLAPLTFDCLLNCLDGVEKSDGVFTIITTNDLSKIDPALGIPSISTNLGEQEFISSRPGRIDKAIELTYMEPSEMKVMASRILKGYDLELEKMILYIEQSGDTKQTPAQFQERCGQIALKCYWEEQEKVSPDTNGKLQAKSSSFHTNSLTNIINPNNN